MLKIRKRVYHIDKVRTTMNLFQMMFEHNRNFMKYEDLKIHVTISKVEQKAYILQILNANNEVYFYKTTSNCLDLPKG